MTADKEMEQVLRACQRSLTKKQYENLVSWLRPDELLVGAHNRVMYDAHAALGMVSAAMSVVKGAPTAAKVALWRDDIARAQATLRSLPEAKP